MSHYRYICISLHKSFASKQCALWTLINGPKKKLSSTLKIINSIKLIICQNVRNAFYIILRSMWFIARKTLHNSCVCRCDIALLPRFFFSSRNPRLWSSKKKEHNECIKKRVVCEHHQRWRNAFSFYLFNDNEIYCMLLFIATQTKDHKCFSSLFSLLSIFVVKHRNSCCLVFFLSVTWDMGACMRHAQSSSSLCFLLSHT